MDVPGPHFYYNNGTPELRLARTDWEQLQLQCITKLCRSYSSIGAL